MKFSFSVCTVVTALLLQTATAKAEHETRRLLQTAPIPGKSGSSANGKVWNYDLDDELPGPWYPYPPVYNDDKLHTIFIGSSAYRDAERCGKTLYEAFTKARRPDLVYIGVVDQRAETDDYCIDVYCRVWAQQLGDSSHCPFVSHITSLNLDYTKAKGPVKARHLQQTLINGEEFCLQVDAHSMLSEDWDVKLIDTWKMTNNEMAVLSTYVANISDYGKDNVQNRHEVPLLCNLDWGSNHVPRNSIAAAAWELPRPKLIHLWGAGLSFSKCHAEINVPYDRYLPHVFDGEEYSRALRLFTHGYDVYAPHQNLVFHHYMPHGRAKTQWGADRGYAHSSVQDKVGEVDHDMHEGMGEERNRSYRRLRRLFGMDPGAQEEDFQQFGLGTVRTLKQFEEWSGVHTSGKNPRIENNQCGVLPWVPHNEAPKAIWQQGLAPKPGEEDASPPPGALAIGRHSDTRGFGGQSQGHRGAGPGSAKCEEHVEALKRQFADRVKVLGAGCIGVVLAVSFCCLLAGGGSHRYSKVLKGTQ